MSEVLRDFPEVNTAFVCFVNNYVEFKGILFAVTAICYTPAKTGQIFDKKPFYSIQCDAPYRGHGNKLFFYKLANQDTRI